MRDQRIGTDMMALAVLAWVSIAVGPWWIGPILFAGAWGVNVWVDKWANRRMRKLINRCMKDLKKEKRDLQEQDGDLKDAGKLQAVQRAVDCGEWPPL